MSNKPYPVPICWGQVLDSNGKVCKVRLYIDHGYILHCLESKAANSKGGKSQLMHGAIVVRRERN